MDFTYTPEQEAFRAKVRDWVRAALPPGWGRTVHEPRNEAERAVFKQNWDRKMFAGGWAGINWPREYGGRGATLVEKAIFLEEMARAQAPEGLNIIGRNLAGPAIIRHGTAEQKERFLRPILTGEGVWCPGFSEPNSGSDLPRCAAGRPFRGQWPEGLDQLRPVRPVVLPLVPYGRCSRQAQGDQLPFGGHP